MSLFRPGRLLIIIVLLWSAAGNSRAAPTVPADYVPSRAKPPTPAREFRGVWVATVNNIDWPSRPGLSSTDQKTELLELLDRAAQLRLNAVILQVRAGADAFYASPYEPWSEYLTGQMGQAPSPFYDPLAFAVAEAHRRGLELHAWFNPFRARHPSGKSRVAASHISQAHPRLVRHYGSYLWLDPGEPAVQEQAIRVILDVVRRYDVDGIHVDDYFYPYPEKGGGGTWLEFPDGPSWSRYVNTGGKLDRKDWRRDNVDRFIERLYRAVKAVKPEVKVGISPFGIWRPGYPGPVRGLDAYNVLYADARKWLRAGWLDYCAPQLYWPIEPKEQGFGLLLKWWADQNVKKRHLWPGASVSDIGPQRTAMEISRQIALTRKHGTGNVLWSIKALRANQGGIATTLVRDVNRVAALVPASPWLDSRAPPRPTLTFGGKGGNKAQWQPAVGQPVWLWVVQWRTNGKWFTEILPGGTTSRELGSPDVVSVAAVDRTGNASSPATIEKRVHAPEKKAAPVRKK